MEESIKENSLNNEIIKINYHAIIVGAGPAGLSAALELLNRGINNILVIEKHQFPRYKCCAGYITNKTLTAYEKVGLNVKDCHYSLIKDFNILYRNKKRLNILNKFLYTNEKIDRVELDYGFFNLAKSAGIEIMENTTISQHNMQTNTLTLSNGKSLTYNNLIFADGTYGFGSRYQKRKKCNIALQMTFECEQEEKIDIHFGVTKRGYAWVSTFNGIVNVGMTDVFTTKKDYKKIFTNFLKLQDFEVSTENLKSAFTPIGICKPIINSNIFYIGDAVGACDPLTLSGLRYALQTGEKCASAIATQKEKIYKSFIRKLKFKFSIMRIMQKVFYIKWVSYITFNIFCRFFGKLVSIIFNNFFVNKK